MKITKLIIPVAGFGTRFLPVTKALPKEMLPILDKPAVQYIVEEAVASGIEDIILVTGQNKRAVEDHFDYNPELEDWLRHTRKTDQLKQIREIAQLANFIYVRQKGPYGNGTPILNARHLVGDEPFAVAWGDDLFFGRPPRLKQLITVFEKYQDPVLSAVAVTARETAKYGIVEGTEVEPGIYQISRLKEKPGPKRTTSRLAAIGSYILTPDIFTELEKTPLRDHELYLPDAIDRLLKRRTIYAKLIEGDYHDIGSKFGWLKANLSVAMTDRAVRPQLKSYLKKLL
ncbi:MAG: UTP--glucose-1-phosphate uridylyltransferase [Candidatus Doudnabacteria bacterium]|nr:UTP--glucose-1-phosphate uridylyltransferase [Candidatus Doudnabacteria bacterium]